MWKAEVKVGEESVLPTSGLAGFTGVLAGDQRRRTAQDCQEGPGDLPDREDDSEVALGLEALG